jgi:hypothetical protein
MSDLQPHIVDEFIAYHQEHPNIYDLFKKYAYQLKGAGRERFSSRAIIERIRWDMNIEWTSTEFKIKDHIIPCYARLLMDQDPGFVGFFARRISYHGNGFKFAGDGQGEML